MQIVPYKNSPDIVVALLRNDVQLMIDFPPAVQGQVNDGKLKVLATSSPKRSPLMPSVPTVDEAGVKGYEVISWNGVGAPKDTPKEIIDTMNKAIREVMAMPEVKEQFAKVGVVAQASTPAELMARLTGDIKKWDDGHRQGRHSASKRNRVTGILRMNKKKLSVAVVGAGMGGLAVAATLRRVGIDVAVYEQAARFARIGAGIQMMPNSMKVLRGIGVEDRLRARWRSRPFRISTGSATPARSPANCRCRKASTARLISACIAPICTMRWPRRCQARSSISARSWSASTMPAAA